MFSFAPVKSHI